MPPRKIDLVAAADARIQGVWEPHVAGDVNDGQVMVAKFGDSFDWHAQPEEDESFLVLRGRVAIDFRDGPVEMGEGEFLVVPRRTEHRPRSLIKRPVVLMFEPVTRVDIGNALSDLTVADLKRL